jgi:hypothetical protein
MEDELMTVFLKLVGFDRSAAIDGKLTNRRR